MIPNVLYELDRRRFLCVRSLLPTCLPTCLTAYPWVPPYVCTLFYSPSFSSVLLLTCLRLPYGLRLYVRDDFFFDTYIQPYLVHVLILFFTTTPLPTRSLVDSIHVFVFDRSLTIQDLALPFDLSLVRSCRLLFIFGLRIQIFKFLRF